MATTEQDTTPEAPVTKETKLAERTYVVLVQIESEEDYAAAVGTGCRIWCEPGAAVAANDEQAIEAIVPADEAGRFVGVAERYFKPRTRTLEPQPPRPVWS